jgi:hypothetical protein
MMQWMKTLVPVVVGAMTMGCPSSTTTDAAVSDERTGDATVQEVGGDAAGDGGCTPQQTLCRGECVDTQSAFLHCGRCMNRCQGTQRCVGGVCVRAGICPRTCMRNSDCNLCTQEGDTTVWCCYPSGGASTCVRELAGRCPSPG